VYRANARHDGSPLCVQHRERVGLVGGPRVESHRLDGGHDRRLLGIALAGHRSLDGADRDALARDAVVRGPGGDGAPIAAQHVRGISLPRPDEVDSLVSDLSDALAGRLQAALGVIQPRTEAEESQPFRLTARRRKVVVPAFDAAVAVADGPAKLGPEIEGENGGHAAISARSRAAMTRDRTARPLSVSE